VPRAPALVPPRGAAPPPQGHHPDLELRWGFVGVTLCTHKIDGLAQADFVLAAKIDRLAAAAPAVAGAASGKAGQPPLPKGLA
jgi:hypothetical protein